MSISQFRRRRRSFLRWALPAVFVLVLLGGYFAYRYSFSPSSGRWLQYGAWLANPEALSEYMLQPGQRCAGAPFAFPTTGVIFGLWDQSYRPGHRHQGLDIFAGTQPGVTPVYAAYLGYLTRQSDWISTVIIRIPKDPLDPNRQIWTYYTHMADTEGNSFIAPAFPPGTTEVYVEAGTLLGYQGNYSGDPVNPTGLHLHFSIVKDDGEGQFLNELAIRNTLDPTPYFNLPVNNNDNPNAFPTCAGVVTFEAWELVSENE
jgi:murein DD-endopeptidase MepM/ murein hydrolase activator NlpD